MVRIKVPASHLWLTAACRDPAEGPVAGRLLAGNALRIG